MVAAAADEAPLQFLQLVADPLRWQLLNHLARSDRRVGEVAQLVGKAQNLVSYHLGELRSGGLVSARQSSADGRDTYYRLDLARFGQLFVAAGAAMHPALELAPRALPAPGAVKRKERVLFLCTGNSRARRSPRRCSLIARRVWSRPEARAVTRSRCTRTPCG